MPRARASPRISRSAAIRNSITVYSNAHHSFDSSPGTTADKAARDAALKVTLAKLATQL